MSSPSTTITIDKALEEKFLACSTLPSLPAVAYRVIEASKSPDIGLSDVADIISADPALAVKLLKTANSPLYSLRRTIHNLREALTLLGLNTALTITLSFSLVGNLQQATSANGQGDLFWRRSLVAATVARHMGLKLGLTNLEDLFLTSLLQDIGMLVIECTDENFYLDENGPVLEHNDRVLLEREKLQIDHAITGAWLLQAWHLPEKLYQAVHSSHQPRVLDTSADADEQYQQCINLSSAIADIWLFEDSQQLLLDHLEPIKAVLSIDDNEFSEFIADINQLLPEISTLFDITISNVSDRDRVLNEARELLLNRSLSAIKQSEHDRHELEKLTQKTISLEDESRRDPLTRLYNRSYFESILEEEFENASKNRWPLSVAFIDLDDFKLVNDQHGHLGGDELLKSISQFFMDHVRETDILARFGGDEFILLLPGSTSSVAENMLLRLQHELRENFSLTHNKKTITQSVSIGVATHFDGHQFNSVSEFLNAADQALYRVKDAGRDNISSY